jgi:hypothetical protein
MTEAFLVILTSWLGTRLTLQFLFFGYKKNVSKLYPAVQYLLGNHSRKSRS